MSDGKYFVNGVECDTFAYVDDRRTGETVVWSATNRDRYLLCVYLFSNGNPMPLANGPDVSVECYLAENGNAQSPEISMEDCFVGHHGEIYVPVKSKYRIPGKVYYCEINVIGSVGEEDESRFKASNFRLAFIE